MRGIQPFALVVFAALLVCLQPALPMWLTVSAFVGIAWKAWAIRSGRGRIPRMILLILAILSWSLIAIDSPTFWHRNTMIAVSVVATLFNLLPAPHNRQSMRLHAAYFALMIGMLVMPRSPMPLPVYGGLTLMIMFSLLLHNLPKKAWRMLLPLGKNILKTAAPVTVVLLPIYFFFPDIRPDTSNAFTSGFAGDLEPGQIASLALSDRLAFRVRFMDDIPPPQKLYWRVSVLEDSQGMTWKKGESPNDEVFHSTDERGQWVYEIMPDIRLGSAIPMLEHTVAIEGDEKGEYLWSRSQDIFRSAKRFLKVTAKDADRFAMPEPKYAPLPEAEDPEVRKLVNALKLIPPEKQIEELIGMFRNFRYTLTPGTLDREAPLADFLFRKRRGFCEHFAAAFATLLRMAGTPARVVVGFQGGTPLGKAGFYQVADADAHAWTEVWLAGDWVRIDPATVAAGAEIRNRNKAQMSALIAAWSAYILETVTEAVKNWSGESDLLWLMVGVLASGLFLIQVIRVIRKRNAIPKWERDMNALLYQLGRRGSERLPGETVRNYLQRSGGDELSRIGELYNACKFGPDSAGSGELELEIHRSLKRLGRPPLRRKKTVA